MKYSFSKHTHWKENDEVVAVFNSFRLRPVYLNKDEFADIRFTCKQGVDTESAEWKHYSSVLEVLRDNKIIVKPQEQEISPLQTAQSKLSEPFPHLLYLIVTDKCNMGCKYCFIKKHHQTGEYPETSMTDTTAKAAIDFFVDQIQMDLDKKEDEKQIIFYGGEPLLNFSVIRSSIKYIESLIDLGVLPQCTSVSMVTNGTLLTEEIVSFFKAHHVSVGVSLDGDKLITEENRPLVSGNESYEKIIRGILLCQDKQIDVGLSVTLTPNSMRRQNAVLEQITSLGVSSLGFNIMMGNDESVPESFHEEAAKFMLHAFETFREQGIYEDRLMRKIQTFVNSQLYLYDCAACGGNQIVAAPNGDLGICHGFVSNRKYFFGNIHGNIDYDLYHKIYSEWAQRTPVMMEECSECEAIAICGGGCPYNSFVNKNSIWALDERFCVHAKETLNWLIWDLYKTNNASRTIEST